MRGEGSRTEASRVLRGATGPEAPFRHQDALTAHHGSSGTLTRYNRRRNAGGRPVELDVLKWIEAACEPDQTRDEAVTVAAETCFPNPSRTTYSTMVATYRTKLTI